MKWLRDERGNITPLICVMLVPVIGAFAVATETSGWFMTQRAMQHAADSAALAAAMNNSGLTTSSPVGTADREAFGVATKYGYTTGGDISVGVTMPTCPSPYTSGNCYQVTISKNVPLRLARIVGYSGDVPYGTGRAKTVTSTAIARAGSKGTYCITAFGTASDAITFKGTPTLDLTGCDIASAGGASCNGHSGDTVGHAYVTDPGKSNDDCGPSEIKTSAPTDIYAGLATKIPKPGSCGGGVTTLPASISGTVYACGGAKLSGTTKAIGDTVLVVIDGDLDVGSSQLLADAGNHLTVIFTSMGTGAGASHIFKGSGLFDFAAPTSGDWSGIAIYTDPRMTAGSFNITDAGNSPTYKVTGLLYMPLSNITIKGAINHKSGGDNCMAMVVKTLSINGTGSIFGTPTSECDRAGLVLNGPPGSGSTALLIQ